MLQCVKLLKRKQESLSPVHTKTFILLKQTHKSVINHFMLRHYIAHKWNIHLNFKNNISVWRYSFLSRKRTMACKKRDLCEDGNRQCILYNIQNALNFFLFLCCNISPCFRQMAQKISSTKGKVLFLRQEKSYSSEVEDCCTTHTVTIYLGHFSCWWENGTYL